MFDRAFSAELEKHAFINAAVKMFSKGAWGAGKGAGRTMKWGGKKMWNNKGTSMTAAGGAFVAHDNLAGPTRQLRRT